MRSKLGIGLVFLGSFLLVVAVIAQFIAPGMLMKTPLDTDNTTRLEGEASYNGVETFPIKVTSRTQADSEKSDDEVVVFRNSTCVVRDEGDVGDCVSSDDPDNRLVTASIDEFATDRVNAEAVNDPKYLPAAATPHEGLVNKWPFEAEKKTYEYWNGTIGTTTEAVYDRTEEIDGLELYVYTVSVPPTAVEIAEGLQGTYESETEIWIDPVTGSIVNQIGSQIRKTETGEPVLLLQAQYTEEQIDIGVDDTSSLVSQLNLIRRTIPIIGYIGGAISLGVGIFLLVQARREEEAGEAAPPKETAPAGAGV